MDVKDMPTPTENQESAPAQTGIMPGVTSRTMKITDEYAGRAMTLLQKYKDQKKELDERLVENEEWWKFHEWDLVNGGKTEAERVDPEPTSAWMFNSIINKHADFMDNFPAPNILAREESDKDAAKILSEVVPCIFDQCEYENTYSDTCWDKIKSGSGLYGIFWDKFKNGIGDITIKRCDILQMAWEPGTEDLQKSPNLFYQSYVDNKILEAEYPRMQGQLGDGILSEIQDYQGDNKKFTEGKSLVTDWYYKRSNVITDKDGIQHLITTVHLCKICQGKVLYATENDPEMGSGLYEHGLYPFVLDTLFPDKNTPAGRGYIDIMKDCQMYIDKMSQGILKNAIVGAKPRYFSKDGGGINEKEYTDPNREIVHYTGSPDDLKPAEHYPLDGVYVTVHANKIDELKETSGNGDFAQGTTTSGVTAASAIAALQEAGSKLSRDMIKTSYRAHKAVVYQVIELIRQFYTTSRVFRITGDNGQDQYVSIDNQMLRAEPIEEDFGLYLGGRKPYFDIKIVPQKSSPFTKIAQNELAKEMYNLGFFNPQLADQALACINMMDFDGKEEVIRRIAENGTLYQQVQQMQMSMQQMAALIADSTGDTRIMDAMAMQNGQAAAGTPSVSSKSQTAAETDDFGNVARETKSSTAGKARERAASASTPNV